MKLLAWDLETSDLKADYGIIFCAGYQLVGEGKPKVLSLLDYEGINSLAKEKKLLKDFSKVLLEADCWLTWFGTYFDIPFIQSRLLYHRLPLLPTPFAHIDGWKTARNRLKLRNNRLRTVQEFLGLENEKDAILGPIWIKAMGGDPTALKYIINHCRKDVAVLGEAYYLLRPLIMDHPNRGLIDGHQGCSLCGSPKIQKRGFHITRTRKYQRLQCQDCGAWSKDPKPVEKL